MSALPPQELHGTRCLTHPVVLMRRRCHVTSTYRHRIPWPILLGERGTESPAASAPSNSLMTGEAMTLTLEARVVTTTYRHLRRLVVAVAVSRLAQRSGDAALVSELRDQARRKSPDVALIDQHMT